MNSRKKMLFFELSPLHKVAAALTAEPLVEKTNCTMLLKKLPSWCRFLFNFCEGLAKISKRIQTTQMAINNCKKLTLAYLFS